MIDQFEQWLHVHKDIGSTELVQALRQCDGGRVQCIVMVSDEFWLSVSRFMRELEINLEDGQNSALVDLFDEHHARKVLAAFGVAYGKLPDFADQMSGEQKEFLRQAVAGLANDGKVICVRLALFADMMKSKQWTTDGLRHAGGTMGVGETFLEETFSVSTAPPKHRYHELAARAVLNALLPEPGSDIKGQMKPREELLQVSNYAVRPAEFDELIRILDSELHLISPVDTEGIESKDNSESAPVTGRTHYQLTHDYLVHSLRAWLTRKQKETRRGRAEVRLAERSALWNARPETRQLPTWWEYLSIRLFTESRRWSTQERKLIRSAGRHHAVRKVGLMVFLIAIAIATWQFFDSVQARQVQVEEKLHEQAAINRAVTLVQQLRDADTESVPEIVSELEPWRPWADAVITEGFQQAAEGSAQKLHLALALMATDQAGVGYLIESLPTLEGVQLDVARRALLPYKELVCQTLWRNLEDSQLDQRAVLSTAITLASYSPDDIRWNQLLPRVATQLTTVATPEQHLDELGAVAHQLVTPLRESLRNVSLPLAERGRAAASLCCILSVEQQIAEGLPDVLVEWILKTKNAEDFLCLLRALRPHSYGVRGRMRSTLDVPGEAATPEQRVNAAAVLLHFGDSDYVWPFLRHGPDPSFRNLLIDRLGHLRVNHQILADHLAQQGDASVRQAIVLILGSSTEEIAAEEMQRIEERLERLYVEDLAAGVHSAVNWTLRQWQMDSRLVEMDGELSQQYDQDFAGQRDWTVSPLGQTYIRILPPAELLMGDAPNSKFLRPTKIGYGFAIAAHEVTVAEFQAFRKQHRHDIKFSPDINCPVNDVSWYDAVAFCNWLSDKEGLPRCYEPNKASEYAAGIRIPDDILQRTGYRLPTEVEWECLCRAGTISAYSFGDSNNLLGKHAWYEENSKNRTWPVGSKLPNAWGAFDTHGNIWEWSHDPERIADRATDRVAVDQTARLLCGGAFDNSESRVQSGDRLVHFPHEYKYSYGFRPARTLPPTKDK